MREIHGLLARRIHLVFATAAFVHNTVNFFSVPSGALLDAADQFILLALGELQVVIRKLCEFLFQLALGNVPVSFGGESAHMSFVWLFVSAARLDATEFSLQVACRLVGQIFFLQIQAFEAHKNFFQKINPRKFCKLQIRAVQRVASCIVLLSVSSVQFLQMPILR